MELFFTHAAWCHKFWVDEGGLLASSDVLELTSDHEEANIRMLLHARHALHEYGTVLIISPDTDVFVMAVGYTCSFNLSLYFLTGSGDKVAMIDVGQVYEELGSDLLKALVGFYSFTGNMYSILSTGTVENAFG